VPPKKLLLVVILFAAFSLSGKCSLINVSGDVSGIWNVDSVMVTGPIRVPSDDSLWIYGGTLVFIHSYPMNCVFSVEGVLMAWGNEGDSVFFTPSTQGQIWHFEFHNNAVGRFRYCQIRHGYWPLGNGGAISCDSSTVTMNNCLIDSCSALYCGGAICCNYSNLILTYSIIADNFLGDLPENPIASGGGIACYNSFNVVISNNQISGNKAIAFSFNQSAATGGGVYIRYSNQAAILLDNLIIGNSAMCNCDYGGAAVGGGLFCDSAFIENNTITGNSSYSIRGGLTIEGDGFTGGPGNIISNTIIWGNGTDSVSEIYWHPQITYSCIGGGWQGEGNFDLDPLFCGADTGNYYISSQSPCVTGGIGGSRVGAFGVGCEYDAIGDDPISPRDFNLLTCYPNPFNNSTTIKFNLRESSHVGISIHDITGRLVEMVADEKMLSGYHNVSWSPKDLSSGIYFCKISTDGESQTQKMVLIK
jgi:hypothetical protein